MASKKKLADTSDPGTKSLAEAGLENYAVMEVHRRDLKNAPYNPRRLDDQQKRRLKAGLKRHGLVAPVTWNKQTGNIVGGHQRTSIMDALMGTADYVLKVAMIDVIPSREKELNILLNNTAAMGDWDMASLSDMLSDKTVAIEGTGFEIADVYKMFGETPLQDRSDDMGTLAAQLYDAQQKFGSVKKSNADKNSQDFYLVVIFRSETDLNGFIAAAGIPNNRYQSGEDFKVKLGLVNAEGEPVNYEEEAVAIEASLAQGEALDAALTRSECDVANSAMARDD